MDILDPIILENIKELLPKNPVIFDIGACKGEYTDFILSLTKDAQLFLFEPNDILFESLKTKYADNDRIKIFHTLIGKSVGNLLFYYFEDNHNEISSIYCRPVFDDLPVIKKFMGCVSVDYVIFSFDITNIDFVKVDVEGAEFDVLKGAEKSMRNKKIRFIQVEYGGTYPDANITFREVIKFVNDLGYNVYSFKDKFVKETAENFIEDYRYENFLITYEQL